MVQITIKKRYFLFLLIIFTFGLVIAFGGNSPSTLGHSSGEIEVTISGSTYTLQNAIDQQLIGSPSTMPQENYLSICFPMISINSDPSCIPGSFEFPFSSSTCCSYQKENEFDIANIEIGYFSGGGQSSTCWTITDPNNAQCIVKALNGFSILDRQSDCVELYKAHYNSQNINGLIGGWGIADWDVTSTSGANPSCPSSVNPSVKINLKLARIKQSSYIQA